MNEWSATIWASISAMTAALVLGLIVTLGSLARESAAIQQEDDNAVAIVKEYRQYSPYEDKTNILPQDVISVILESKGMPEIWVDEPIGTPGNFAWKWTTTTRKTDFSTTALTELFPVDGKYSSKLIPNPNGEIGRIEFRRQ